MKTAYFDCFSGAGGDMLAGALIDAGASAERLIAQLDGLRLPGFRIRAEKVRKQGFAATRFAVDLDPDLPQPHRHLSHVRKLFEAADLPAAVRDRCLAAFERLADAEAEVHGVTREKVHFHEVGAVDAIVDVAAVMLALADLDVEKILCSPLPTGSGTVTCEHGVMPVPAPATALLLKGVPLAASAEHGELLTPTAAAVLTTLSEGFGPLPAMTIQGIGMGAGTRDNKTTPNVTRVFIGDVIADTGETISILEANIDDAPGEWLGHCLGRLLKEGALDAYSVPIYMKKNRPGVLLTVLCEPARVPDMESILFEETSTFGVRRLTAQRTKLDRRHEDVETPFGQVRIKVGTRDGRIVSATPEYDDCARQAEEHGVALRTVMEAATQAWRQRREQA